MPDGYIHRKISKILLGESCRKTNKAIDYPVKILGKNHRILFHDPLSALAIGFILDGYSGAFSALLHLAADEYFSKNKNVGRLIEYLL